MRLNQGKSNALCQIVRSKEKIRRRKSVVQLYKNATLRLGVWISHKEVIFQYVKASRAKEKSQTKAREKNASPVQKRVTLE